MEEKSQKKKHDRSFAYLLGRIHGKFWGYRLLIHGYNPDTAKYTITTLGDKVLAEIQDGTFASKWIAENKNGLAHFNAMRAIKAEHQLEKVGEEIRKMYSWNGTDKYAD